MTKRKSQATRDAQRWRAAERDGFWRGAERAMEYLLDCWPISARDARWRKAYRRGARYVERLQEWAITSDMLAARRDDDEPDIPEPSFLVPEDLAVPGHPLRRQADEAALAVSRLVESYEFDADPRWGGLEDELLALIGGAEQDD